MVFTSSGTHTGGKSLPVLLLDPPPRTGEMLPSGGTDAARRSVARLEFHFYSAAATHAGWALLAPAANAHS
ncbi:hypothetical protein [Polaromonas sp. LjRoot131]|uniref:hypothetical protein n=1 Tax=Polaromonas sp. LjRoot131 TaxID=3342262 RepID=UPI003ECFD9C7